MAPESIFDNLSHRFISGMSGGACPSGILAGRSDLYTIASVEVGLRALLQNVRSETHETLLPPRARDCDFLDCVCPERLCHILLCRGQWQRLQQRNLQNQPLVARARDAGRHWEPASYSPQPGDSLFFVAVTPGFFSGQWNVQSSGRTAIRFPMAASIRLGTMRPFAPRRGTARFLAGVERGPVRLNGRV